MTTKKALFGSLGAIAILLVSQIAAQVFGSIFLLLRLPAAAGNAAGGICYAILTYYLLRLFSAAGLKTTMEELGMPHFTVKGKWAVVAVLLPAAVTGVCLLLPGHMERHDVPVAETVAAGVFFTGIGAGFAEEMVFRGVIQNLVEKRWGRTAAIWGPSAVFAAVHLLGADFSPMSSLLVMLAGTAVGVMFSLIAREGGSVWNSGIVHALWNMTMVGGILRIGGTADEYAIFGYVLHSDSLLLTGGEFGIESSLLALGAYVIVILFADWSLRKRPDFKK